MRTLSMRVFSFEELSEDAKDSARVWWRSRYGFDEDVVTDALREKLAERGFPVEAKDIVWQLAHIQGDGVSFYAHIDLQAAGRRHLDAAERRVLARAVAAGVTARTREGLYGYGRGPNSCFIEVSPSVEYRDCLTPRQRSVVAKIQTALENELVTLRHDLQQLGYQIIAEEESDESLEGFVEENGYEFTEDGRPVRRGRIVA